MRIQEQLRLVIYCFILHLGLLFLLFASGVIGVQTLLQRQKWVDHTNFVLNEVEFAERAFSDADYAGRNQTLAGESNPKVETYRQIAFERLATLKETVADNPVQVENITTLESVMRSNFKIQDEQLQSAVKTNESITYKLDQTAQKMQFAESINNLFTRIKINEMILLRDDRMPRLAMWQWRLVYFTGVILLLKLIVTIALFFFHIRLLRRQVQVIKYMDEMKHKSESGQNVNERELEKLLHFIRQDNQSGTLEMAG